MKNNYIPNRRLEDDLFETDTRPATAETIWKNLRPGYHVRQKHGFGRVYYKTRYQYINDKLTILQDEFLCDIYREDVEHLVYECLDIFSIDQYCRQILIRELERMEKEGVDEY